MGQFTMSWQQRRFYGRREFGAYPRISFAPTPDATVTAYVREALEAPKPCRARPFVCPRTGKRYVFPENYATHAKMLAHVLAQEKPDFFKESQPKLTSQR